MARAPHIVIPGRRPAFPPMRALVPDADGLVAVGGRLDRDTLCEAYRKGVFPWTGEHPIPWYSPDPRCVLVPERFHAARSMRSERRALARRGRLAIRFDHAFDQVVRACAGMPRPGDPDTWITDNVQRAYRELHALGIAHSVEVHVDGALCGGLYGLRFGAAFFGESMFSDRPGASKLALWALCRTLAARGFAFVDCQAITPHLLSLGAEPWPRARYLAALTRAAGSWRRPPADAPTSWRAWTPPAP